MKTTYPIILIPEKEGYTVFVPDFDINTEGKDLTDALEMAKDAIGIIGIDMEDDGKALPTPSSLEDIKCERNQLKNLVVIDFTEYRRKNDFRTVKKNCTLPSWLCYQAEKANINFSQILQEGIKKELKITERP